MNYMAVGPFCWGVGLSREEAIRNAKKNWNANYTNIKRPQDKHFSVYQSEGKLTCDDMGYVHSSKKDLKQIQKSILAE